MSVVFLEKNDVETRSLGYTYSNTALSHPPEEGASQHRLTPSYHPRSSFDLLRYSEHFLTNFFVLHRFDRCLG